MPNGFDKNWRRLCAAIDGFYVSHGKWPSRVLLFSEAIENLKTDVFTEESFAKLEARLDLVPSEASMIAQDDDGNQYSYGEQGFPETQPSPSAEEWIGLQPDGPGSKHGEPVDLVFRTLERTRS